MARTKPCPLCNNVVDAKTTVQLFSTIRYKNKIGYKNKWASRITALLVDETDLLSFQCVQVVHTCTSFRVPGKGSCRSSGG